MVNPSTVTELALIQKAPVSSVFGAAVTRLTLERAGQL